MAPAETYKLMILRNPEGITLTDVFYIEGNRRRPVAFKKVGEMIDFEKVDIKSMVVSGRSGVLAQLEKSGAVKRFQVESTAERMQEFHGLRANLEAASSKKFTGVSGQTSVVILEPGIQVAVGDGGMSPAPSGATKLEDGVYAGGPEVSHPAFASVAASAESLPLEKVTMAPGLDFGVGGLPATGGASMDDVSSVKAVPELVTAPSWKDSKTVKEQEAWVVASKDKVFLQSLLDDTGETKKIKSLAKKALAELR